MNIAVPLDKNLVLYHNNPYTAPKFAIYSVKGDKTNISFHETTIVDNPRYAQKCKLSEAAQVQCACNEKEKKDFQHICEHYALLEVIGNCRYLLADKYCENTIHTLRNGGIIVFRIPTIIKDTHTAIKNFLIGASV